MSSRETEPAQYGQVSYFGIGTGADTESAQAFVEYLLSDGYSDWLSTPRGHVPMRTGPADVPDSFVEEWKGLDIGVDTRTPFGEVYDEVVATLIDGTRQLPAVGASPTATARSCRRWPPA